MHKSLIFTRVPPTYHLWAAHFLKPAGMTSIAVAAIKILIYQMVLALRHPAPVTCSLKPQPHLWEPCWPPHHPVTGDLQIPAPGLHAKGLANIVNITVFHSDCHHTQRRRVILWVSAVLIDILSFHRLEVTRTRNRCVLKASHSLTLAYRKEKKAANNTANSQIFRNVGVRLMCSSGASCLLENEVTTNSSVERA